ncbi:hypothetical protein PENTCL1PPCAC_13136, partial [Pristionchus entomophagus]
ALIRISVDVVCFTMEDAELEVVEEELVVDDSHLEYDSYYEDDEYERYADVDDGPASEPNDLLDTMIIKINPESLVPMKRRCRVPAADITDVLYTAFCEKVVKSEHSIKPPRMNELLDNIYHSGDWAIARNFPDVYLGILDLVMVHLPTSKFLLKTEDRKRLLTESIVKHQNARNPVGTVLQEIQKNYLGLPPIGQLRNMLSLELRKVFPLVQSSIPMPLPTTRKMFKRASSLRMGYGQKKKKPVYFTLKSSEKEAERVPPAISPIDDEIYEVLAEVIASGQRPAEMEFDWPMPIRALLAKGSLVAERIDRHSADLKEVIRPGWCIRERSTGRIVPRKTDVNRIWSRIRDRMIRTNSTSQIIAYVDAKFVGITSADQRRSARLDDVYKGARVVFPKRPTVIGRRPMQYVQIDFIDAPFHEYHSEEMESALLIIDLHSQFAFCKPIDPSDNSTLRFLYDSFASFGPPEAYLISPETKNRDDGYIHQLMGDVQRHYKISIKFIGPAKDHPCGKAISSDAVKRAEEDGELRWIDTLDSAVLEWNQRQNNIFDSALSPFEVMFGRSPWHASTNILPPWIQEETREEGQREGGGGESTVTPVPVKERIETVSLLAPEAKMDESGAKMMDPGTGMRFEIGDRVYVRNMHFMEESGETSAGKEGKREEYRYFRGVVVEEDNSHPSFFYRIVYDGNLEDQDAQPIDAWPMIHHDINYDEFSSAWFSPWDVAPSTFDLQCRRTTNPPLSLSSTRCSCELEYCDLLVDEKCVRGLSLICCARQEDGPCPAHQTARRRCGRKRKEEMHPVRIPKTIPEGDRDARYIFKDGSLVRITQVPLKQMELPDEILQD